MIPAPTININIKGGELSAHSARSSKDNNNNSYQGVDVSTTESAATSSSTSFASSTTAASDGPNTTQYIGHHPILVALPVVSSNRSVLRSNAAPEKDLHISSAQLLRVASKHLEDMRSEGGTAGSPSGGGSSEMFMLRRSRSRTSNSIASVASGTPMAAAGAAVLVSTSASTAHTPSLHSVGSKFNLNASDHRHIAAAANLASATFLTAGLKDNEGTTTSTTTNTSVSEADINNIINTVSSAMRRSSRDAQQQ